MTNLAQGWARLLVTSLAASGARRFVVSPGSRSTPLALAIAAEPGVETTVVVDERAAAFTALGMARATGEPAVALCTSGTAVAHYYPAIVEASEAGLPLIALTADRPWEAMDCGSSQTIDQTKMFGGHVRRFVALGAPEATRDAFEAVARMAVQAVAASLGPVPGPVHVNAPFRKPLEPVTTSASEAWEAIAADVKIPRAHRSNLIGTMEAVDDLVAAIQRAGRGVIVAGPRPGAPLSAKDIAVVEDFAKTTGFPVLAEATSGLRFTLGDACIGSFDAMLRSADFEKPDLVVQLGWAPISTAFAAWVKDAKCRVFAIAGHGWNDPNGIATDVIDADVVETLREALMNLVRREPVYPAWREALVAADRAARDVASRETGEPEVARAAVACVPAGGWLFVGNSRPVRDLDSFVEPAARDITILHQRGAAGIDGLVAGAAGASLATGRPGVLLLGDVSLSHDLSSLAIAREVKAPLAIVAIDNGGGRIFDELPVGKDASLAAARERLFTTAPRIDWKQAAGAFGVAFEAVAASGVAGAMRAALARGGATLIVARVEAGDRTPRERLFEKTRAVLKGAR